MRTIVAILIVASACLLSVADASAWARSSGHRGGGGTSAQSDSTTGSSASVPEPSTLYAVGSGLALLGGAGWYIRRRK